LTQDQSDLPNFKQLCGNSTDLIVTYLKMNKNYEPKFENEILLMIKQLLFILNEFCIQTVESIVRLGCACLRHFIMGVGDNFTTQQWDLISIGLRRACDISLHPLTRISMTYSPFSDSFYGDLAAGIKVAARRDSTVDDNLHLKQLKIKRQFKDISLKMNNQHFFIKKIFNALLLFFYFLYTTKIVLSYISQNYIIILKYFNNHLIDNRWLITHKMFYYN